MIEVERRISGEWIELREAAKDPYTLTQHLKFTAERLEAVGAELRRSVEEGLLEYKDVILRRAFITLEAVQFKSVRFEELAARERPLEELLFVTLLERLLCSGVVALSREKAPNGNAAEGADVNAVLADLRSRIAADPAFRNHPAVKNIFVQVALYQKERKKMEELLPMIMPDKRAVFRANFQSTFQKNFDSIRRHYGEILRQEEAARRKERQIQEDPLLRLSLGELAPLLASQAKEVSRLRSTLAFAREDKYKTRGVLVGLYNERGSFTELVERERRAYSKLCSEETGLARQECAARLNHRLWEEVIYALERFQKVEEKP
jgi:uncharacterized protein with von Willebrand factor type A (vWA) domain